MQTSCVLSFAKSVWLGLARRLESGLADAGREVGDLAVQVVSDKYKIFQVSNQPHHDTAQQ